MDINKYIGKFLLKNKYCSLPGLGVFDLKKESAKLNSSNETIAPPSYKVTFTPVGSIDDTFASFIATAENVSISNASNNIREYCKAVKDELGKTGKYEIDFLGRFSMANNKIVFQQSDELDLGVEPAPLAPLVEKPKSPETPAYKPDYSYPPANQKRGIPVLKIALPIALLILLITGAYFGYDFYKKNQVEAIPVEEPTQVDTLATVIDSNAVHATDTSLHTTDSLRIQDSIRHADTLQNTTNAATSLPASASSSYNVAVLSFENQASADSKAKKLKGYGNNASVVNSNGRFVVVINASVPVSDTAKLVDSLRRWFNPKGPVYIMK